MPCVRCGQPGYASGAGLLCATHGGIPDAATVAAMVAVGTPTFLWQVFTGAFALAGVGYGLLQAANVWTLSSLLPPGELSRSARDALWAYLTMFLVWFVTVGGIATRLGHDKRIVLRHWTVLVWRVALLPTLAFTLLSDPASTDLSLTADSASGADAAAASAAVSAGASVGASVGASAVAEASLAVNQAAIAFSTAQVLTTALLVAYTAIVWRRLRPVPLPDLV